MRDELRVTQDKAKRDLDFTTVRAPFDGVVGNRAAQIGALVAPGTRLMALIRRSRGSEHPRFACGPLVYDSGSKQFTLGHEPLVLTPREHAALRALVQRSGEPLSKQEILDRVFSDEQEVNPEAVEVLVHRLRKRLARSTVHITTLRGLGYVLECSG